MKLITGLDQCKWRSQMVAAQRKKRAEAVKVM